MKRTLRSALDRAPPDRSYFKGTMLQYCKSEHCVLCDAQCKGVLCESCVSRGAPAYFTLSTRQRQLERRHDLLVQHCMRCMGSHERTIHCVSLDCQHLYARLKLERQQLTAREHCLQGGHAFSDAAVANLNW